MRVPPLRSTHRQFPRPYFARFETLRDGCSSCEDAARSQHRTATRPTGRRRRSGESHPTIQLQPLPFDVVPPPHVTFAEPTTAHAPLHVMLQVPEVHTTFDPAPTVCVHDVPAHVTLQLSPHVPVHVAPDWQSKRQPLVVELHVSNVQAIPDAQLHAVPEHGGTPQPASEKRPTARTNNIRIENLLEQSAMIGETVSFAKKRATTSVGPRSFEPSSTATTLSTVRASGGCAVKSDRTESSRLETGGFTDHSGGISDHPRPPRERPRLLSSARCQVATMIGPQPRRRRFAARLHVRPRSDFA